MYPLLAGCKLPEGSTKQILAGMAAHTENAFVQVAACQVFKAGIETADDSDAVRGRSTVMCG